jgi:hypothetical protein
MVFIGASFTLYMLVQRLRGSQAQPLGQPKGDGGSKDIENYLRSNEDRDKQPLYHSNDNDDYYNTPPDDEPRRKINFGLVSGFLAKQG